MGKESCRGVKCLLSHIIQLIWNSKSHTFSTVTPTPTTCPLKWWCFWCRLEFTVCVYEILHMILSPLFLKKNGFKMVPIYMWTWSRLNHSTRSKTSLTKCLFSPVDTWAGCSLCHHSRDKRLILCRLLLLGSADLGSWNSQVNAFCVPFP